MHTFFVLCVVGIIRSQSIFLTFSFTFLGIASLALGIRANCHNVTEIINIDGCRYNWLIPSRNKNGKALTSCTYCLWFSMYIAYSTIFYLFSVLAASVCNRCNGNQWEWHRNGTLHLTTRTALRFNTSLNDHLCIYTYVSFWIVWIVMYKTWHQIYHIYFCPSLKELCTWLHVL